MLRVAVLEPDRYLVLRSDDGAARLARAASTYVMRPGSLIIERNTLLGIKQHAEAGTFQEDGIQY